MNLRLDLAFIVHSLNLYIPYLTTAYAIGRTEYVDGWFPNLSTGVTPDHRRWSIQATYPLQLRVVAGVILVDSRMFPLHNVSICPKNAPSFQLSFSALPFYPSPKWSLMFISLPPPVHPRDIFCSPFPRRSTSPTLGPRGKYFTSDVLIILLLLKGIVIF